MSNPKGNLNSSDILEKKSKLDPDIAEKVSRKPTQEKIQLKQQLKNELSDNQTISPKDSEEIKTNPSEKKENKNGEPGSPIDSEKHDENYNGKRKRCPLVEGCDSIENYTHLNYIHEGVYGVVFRAQDKQTGQVYAIKKAKFMREKEGFPVTSIREINLLLGFDHPNIVNVKEVVTGSTLDKIYIVMEYVEHELKDLIEHVKFKFSVAEIKCLMKHLLQAVDYLHNRNIMHRDLKTSNILYSNKGFLKVCDFGLGRKFMGKNRNYTVPVVTLWYRSPELLLGTEKYTTAIDIWSVGCIFAELLLREPLFKGQTEGEQIDFIFRTLGNPTTTTWPGWRDLRFARNLQPKNYATNRLPEIFPRKSVFGEAYLSDKGFDLLSKMLLYDPEQRITAAQALSHPWFSEYPDAQVPEKMPNFPATNEVPRDLRKKKI